MIILVTILFLLLSFIFSIYPLFKEKNWLELSVILLIILISSAYVVQFYINAHILPNPGVLISKLDTLAKAIENYFKI